MNPGILLSYFIFLYIRIRAVQNDKFVQYKDKQKTTAKQAKKNPKRFWKCVRKKTVTKGEIWDEIKIKDTTVSVSIVVDVAHKAKIFSSVFTNVYY